MGKSVLALGLDPIFADYSAMPNFTPEMVRAFIGAQIQRVRESGYEVDECFVDLGETAEAETAKHLSGKEFDCIVIGAGLRDEKQLLLFEKLLNMIHEQAPEAKICFNSTPADTAEAVKRWV